MSDINPLEASSYYSGLQNASSQAAKNQKKEKVSAGEKTKFSKLLKSKLDTNPNINAADFPPEILEMDTEDAAVFLRDAVEIAGKKVAQNATTENLMEFRKTVQQFIKYIVQNNYEVKSKKRHGFTSPMQTFSKYNTKLRERDPRLIIPVINEKLDAMTRGLLNNQKNNLKLLEQINEIKGLIVDLMQS